MKPRNFIIRFMNNNGGDIDAFVEKIQFKL